MPVRAQVCRRRCTYQGRLVASSGLNDSQPGRAWSLIQRRRQGWAPPLSPLHAKTELLRSHIGSAHEHRGGPQVAAALSTRHARRAYLSQSCVIEAASRSPPAAWPWTGHPGALSRIQMHTYTQKRHDHQNATNLRISLHPLFFLPSSPNFPSLIPYSSDLAPTFLSPALHSVRFPCARMLFPLDQSLSPHVQTALDVTSARARLSLTAGPCIASLVATFTFAQLLCTKDERTSHRKHRHHFCCLHCCYYRRCVYSDYDYGYYVCRACVISLPSHGSVNSAHQQEAAWIINTIISTGSSFSVYYSKPRKSIVHLRCCGK